MRYKTVLLFGAPGSGKGTQGKILGAIPGFYHSACGDVFRTLDLQSEMGRIFWQYSSQGKLVPDEFTVKLWKNFIKGMEMINSFHPESDILILDGIPRMGFPERNEAKRFIILIDTLYDHRVKLLASAEAQPPELYAADSGPEVFEFDRTVSRLIEMRSDEYLSMPHGRPDSEASGRTTGLVET